MVVAGPAVAALRTTSPDRGAWIIFPSAMAQALVDAVGLSTVLALATFCAEALLHGRQRRPLLLLELALHVDLPLALLQVAARFTRVRRRLRLRIDQRWPCSAAALCEPRPLAVVERSARGSSRLRPCAMIVWFVCRDLGSTL